MRLKREKLTDETETHSARKWLRSITNSVLGGSIAEKVGFEGVAGQIDDGVLTAVVQDLQVR